ncbi:MAG TPA: hypothetical protein VND23_01315 [Acidimicrobiales bacterium]|nr:hypothetical protein [Acidimicrobiales bacterium]
MLDRRDHRVRRARGTVRALATHGRQALHGGVGDKISLVLAPADRPLYALRDVTATVESIPLVAASIMSKKIAEATGALVLDVEVGSGAFMSSRERARELARTMVALGRDHDLETVAIPSAMDTSLGRTAGNALEVTEVVEVLSGGGPEDVVEITLALAREMLDLAGIGTDPALALRDGSALEVWREMVSAQGGDPYAPLRRASRVARRTSHVARRTSRPCAPSGREFSAGSTRAPSASRRGSSVQGAHARRTP